MPVGERMLPRLTKLLRYKDAAELANERNPAFDAASCAGSVPRISSSILPATYGDAWVPAKPRIHRTRNRWVREAHEAIRQTGLSRAPEDQEGHLDPAAAALYALIRDRALTSQMRAARFERVRLRSTRRRGCGWVPWSRAARFVYDYGANWHLDVTVEEVRDGDPDLEYPVFVDGARRCPPEDVGGPDGFMDFLEAVLDPAHEEHRAMLDWYGGSFDPVGSDEARARVAMENMARRRCGPLASLRSGSRRPKR